MDAGLKIRVTMFLKKELLLAVTGFTVVSLRGGTTKQEPHPTLSKGEGFKMFF